MAACAEAPEGPRPPVAHVDRAWIFLTRSCFLGRGAGSRFSVADGDLNIFQFMCERALLTRSHMWALWSIPHRLDTILMVFLFERLSFSALYVNYVTPRHLTAVAVFTHDAQLESEWEIRS